MYVMGDSKVRNMGRYREELERDIQLISLPCCWEMRLAASPVTLRSG